MTSPSPARRSPRHGRLPGVVLKPGREKSLRLRHPWIFSGAVASVEGDPESGSTVELRTSDGSRLAVAAWSPHSQIRARVWSFDDVTIDDTFLASRIAHACARRATMLDEHHTACRLIHGESDGLPGVVADRYGDLVVVQLLAAGADAWRDAIVAGLREATGARCIVERSDADVRTLEGLQPRSGVIHGTLPDTVEIREAGVRYGVDVLHGQKTGFYLDQRDNRARVGALARGRNVLNAFCYTGGFTLAAMAGGATAVTSIDSSGDALAMAASNLARNPSLEVSRATWIEADVFAELRRLRDAGRAYDLIVLDPPKFAPTAQHAPRAARAYKDINLWALRLLRPGGRLATFSCSGGVTADLFQKIVAGAALDAGADASIVGRMTASADHPVALAFPEGDYLKGLLLAKR
jgi:23S rRNA (cytosine1962-C5)-methyltransferase